MQDADTLSISRIVVALDASPHSLAALDAAVRIGRLFGASIEGVFVQDVNLIRAASLPFAREVGRLRSAPGDLSDLAIRRHFRVQERRARHELERAAAHHGLRTSFRTLEGQVLDELAEAADRADLITIGQSGRSTASRSKFGTVARRLVARTRTPVLLVRRDMYLSLPVVVVDQGSPGARDRALALAARVAREENRSALIVLVPGTGGSDLSEKADAISATLDVPSIAFYPFAGRVPEEVMDLAGRHGAGLVVLPADCAVARPDLLEHLVAIADMPILIVQDPSAAD